jgi:hypothetical protein
MALWCGLTGVYAHADVMCVTARLLLTAVLTAACVVTPAQQ